jgi:predicted ATPase/class 3 adenylate cyclase
MGEPTGTTAGQQQTLPTGTVTFLFTDIEGSTELYRAHPGDFPAILEAQQTVIRTAAEAQGGHFVSEDGDACFIVFASAKGAVAAAAAAQREIASRDWPGGATVKVRMGLHTGEGILGGRDYVGLDVHRAARIGAAGHGRQILLSASTVAVIGTDLPEGTAARDLGEFTLKDFPAPETLTQLSIDGLPSDFAPLRLTGPARSTLPLQLTSFIGRDRELTRAEELLAGTRLLTLTGPGGTGKSRFSIELARRSEARFPNGAYFVALASISDPSLISSTILDTIGGWPTGEKGGAHELLLGHLADRSYLIVLDNYEHVLEGAALVPEILRASLNTKIIVTSRAALRVSGEQEYPVPPLSTEDDGDEPEAVALFRERATAVRPGFTLDAEGVAAVAQLAERLDGLPLAIELAASRVNVLSPSAILERLGSQILKTDARDLPERQRSLNGAIGWSYDLLFDPVKRVFERFSVFAGGATLDIAEAVCDPDNELDIPVLDALALLLDNSLLRRTDLSTDTRFHMLMTIQQYAEERLAAGGDLALTRRRHADAYLALAERAGPELTRADRRLWLDRLTAEHDNLRNAVTCAVEQGDADTALRFISALWRFWHTRGHVEEASGRIATILAMPGADPRTRARGLEAAGGIAYWSGDLDLTGRHYTEALELMREHGDEHDVADALYNLMFHWTYTGSLERGEELARESLEVAERVGYAQGIANAHWGLGNVTTFQEKLEVAREHFLEAADRYRELGDVFGECWAVFELAHVAARMGDPAGAREYLRRGIPLVAAADDSSAIALFGWGFANAANLEGDDEEVAFLYGALETVGAETGIGLAGLEINRSIIDDETIARLKAEYPEAFEAGRSVSRASLLARMLES